MTTDVPKTCNVSNAPPTGPLQGEDLHAALNALTAGERIDEVLAQLALASYSLGFARTAGPRLREAAERMNQGPTRSAVEHMVTCIVQKAVIDAFSTFDQTGEGTNSLNTALNVIKRHLDGDSPSRERDAALALVREIRSHAFEERTPKLVYVRYMRHKWAAHSTMDRSVDAWDDGKTVDFTKMEAGLEQMRLHFYELATLISMVPALQPLEGAGRRTDANRVRIGLGWEGFGQVASGLMTSLGDTAASQLLDTIEPALIPGKSDV